MILHRITIAQLMFWAALPLHWLSSVGAEITAEPTGPVEYKQSMRVCDFASAKEGDSKMIPSGLRGWEFKIENRADEKLSLAACIAPQYHNAAISIGDVVYSVEKTGTGAKNWYRIGGTNKNISAYCSFGVTFPTSLFAGKQCVDFDLGLRFKNFQEHVQPMLDFTPEVHKTIGYLDDDEMKATEELRTTPFLYRQTADVDAAPLLSTQVDLVAMARLSEYFRGKIRHEQSEIVVQCEMNELICEHLNDEIAGDLDRLLHGARFTRDYFLQQDTEYLVRMGHIADMLLIPQLKVMVHDALYHQVNSTPYLDRKLPPILRVLRYALTVHDNDLFKHVLEVVRYHEYNTRHPEMFAQIRQAIAAVNPMAATALLFADPSP